MNLAQDELHVLMIECPATWLPRLEYLDVALNCDWDMRRMFDLQNFKISNFVSDCMKTVDNWY